MKLTTTRILSVLIACLIPLSGWSMMHLQQAKAEAIRSAGDLYVIQRDTSELKQITRADASSPGHAATDTTDLTGKIRNAATAAGVSDQMLSIEPSQSGAVGADSSGQMSGQMAGQTMFIRFGALSIEQLVHFATAVTDRADGTQVSILDLTAPEGMPAATVETWATQMTLSDRSVSAARQAR